MNLQKYKYNFNFFNWIKKSELVELNEINTDDDPVRPELNNEFRTSQGRKIFGLKYNEEIEGVVCIAFTNDIPTTVKELELMSKAEEKGEIAIAFEQSERLQNPSSAESNILPFLAVNPYESYSTPIVFPSTPNFWRIFFNSNAGFIVSPSTHI